jgi:virulence factor Mce-like protein
VRRLLWTGAVVLVLAGALMTSAAGGDDGSGGSAYRVDAIFDNAGFLIPDQDVKIAGAKVGKVAEIHLTPDRKARISMDIDRAFAPFRSDADCTIQPQSLIGEKFIQCTPGTVDGRPLQAVGDTPPTVPLSGTHAPVDLDLVLSTFREPTTTRLSLLLGALGNGLAGHGTDLNEAIRRANPALQETNRLLALVNADRRTIQSLVGESDRVLQVLADRREDVAAFVEGAAGVTATTGRRKAELRATLRGLPALLDQTKPALADLQALAQTGTPVVRSLGAAAPATTGLLTRLQPFSRQVRPTLRSLGDAARTGRATVTGAAPQLRRLQRLTVSLKPVARLTADLFQSTRDKGAVEGLLRFVYYATTAQARYDGVSHILPAFPVVTDTCNLYATTSVKECDTHFAAGTTTATARRQGTDVPGRAKADGKAPAARTPSAPAASGAPATPAPPARPSLEDLPKAVGGIVDGLLGGLTGKAKAKATPAPSSSAPAPSGAPAPAARDLLDFLLGR